MVKTFLLSVLLITNTFLSAQTPQWNWAKSAGGTAEEDVQGNHTTINLDSAGNVYELVISNSVSLSFGTFNFTNPNGATPNNSWLSLTYFVKYSPQGTVLWAKQYRNGPGGYVIPGPNSLFVRPDGTSYLHFSMYQDSIVVGNKVAYNNAIGFSNPGACIAQYDANGNVVRLTTYTKPYGGWTEIMPLPNNQMLALTTIGTADTINNIPVTKGSILAILDSVGNPLKVKSLGYDSNSIFNIQQVVDSRYIAINQHSIYLLMSPSVNVRYNQSVIPFDSAYSGPLLVKLDTGLNFIWAKPIDKHFGALITTDELDNVYLPFTAASRDTVRLDTIVVSFPFRYLDHFYGYLGLGKLNGAGAAQWIDTILLVSQAGGGVNSVCADRLGNSYLLGRFSDPTFIGPDTLHNGGNFFIAKYGPAGDVKWVQTTQNANGRLSFIYNCMADDGHGNIYINGGFADPNAHLSFGKDSLIVHTPINNYPLAADVFLARINNCNPLTPTPTATSPLSWCGNDSVQLTAASANTYLWNTGDTTQTITTHQTGWYSAYAIDTLGCYAQSKPDTITIYPQPALQATTQNVRCKGMSDGKILLQANNTTGTFTYTFSPAVEDSLSVSPGTYHITLTDSVGCSTTDTVVITEPAAALSLQATYYPPSNGNSGIAVATATGGTPGYSFNWGIDFFTSDTLNNPSPGLYLVTVLDTNGCSATDSLLVPVTTATPQITSAQIISIYPNPAINSLYIETPVDGELKIYNELGAIVQQQKVSAGKSRIETSIFSKGTYLVEVITNNSKHKSKLIIE